MGCGASTAARTEVDAGPAPAHEEGSASTGAGRAPDVVETVLNVLAVAGELVVAAGEANQLVCAVLQIVRVVQKRYLAVLTNRDSSEVLARRMELACPSLMALQEHLGTRDTVPAGMMDTLRAVHDACKLAHDLIEGWAARGAGFFGTLKQGLSANTFGAQFAEAARVLDVSLAQLERDATLHTHITVDKISAQLAALAARDADATKADHAALARDVAEQVNAAGAAALPGLLAEVGLTPEALAQMVQDKVGVKLEGLSTQMEAVLTGQSELAHAVHAGEANLSAQLAELKALLEGGKTHGDDAAAEAAAARIAQLQAEVERAQMYAREHAAALARAAAAGGLRSQPSRRPDAFAVSASADGTARVWRLADGVCIHTLANSDTSKDGETAPEEKKGGFLGRIGALVSEADKFIDDVKGVWAALADVGGGRVATGGRDGAVRVWDASSGEQVGRIQTGANVRCMAALWGGRLAVGHFDVNRHDVTVWRLDGGERVTALAGHTREVRALAVVGGDGGGGERLLASGSEDKSIRLWAVDLGTGGAGACVGVLTGHTGYVEALTHLGGGLLLSGGRDGALRVWDAGARACLGVQEDAHGDNKPVLAACGLPGGAGRAVSGGERKRVVQWQWHGAGWGADAGPPLQGHTNWVRCLAPASADGRWLLSASDDDTVRLWDTAAQMSSGAAAVFKGHTHRVYAVVALGVVPLPE